MLVAEMFVHGIIFLKYSLRFSTQFLSLGPSLIVAL